MLCVGSHQAGDSWLCFVPAAPRGGSGASSFCQGRAQPGAGAKSVVTTSASHPGGGLCSGRIPFSPAHPEAAPTPAQSQRHCLGHLGKGNEGPGGLQGQGPLLLPASSPLHFNTLPHLQRVCTAQNVPSIISVCTFATVCAGCTLKAIKSSFVCVQGSPGFFSPNTPELTLKHGTSHPWKAWACLG